MHASMKRPKISLTAAAAAPVAAAAAMLWAKLSQCSMIVASDRPGSFSKPILLYWPARSLAAG